MKAKTGARRHWLLMIGIMTIAEMSTGCAVLLAQVGKSLDEIPGAGVTRTEVHKQLGDSASSEDRQDGTRIDRYEIQLQLPEGAKMRENPVEPAAYSLTPFGWLVNAIETPVFISKGMMAGSRRKRPRG